MVVQGEASTGHQYRGVRPIPTETINAILLNHYVTTRVHADGRILALEEGTQLLADGSVIPCDWWVDLTRADVRALKNFLNY